MYALRSTPIGKDCCAYKPVSAYRIMYSNDIINGSLLSLITLRSWYTCIHPRSQVIVASSGLLLLSSNVSQFVAQTLRLSMDSFVLELLVRLFEPHTAKTHLAQFCQPSDPEPTPPHYSSHMIRATLDYMPTCYGSSAADVSFLRLLSKRTVRSACV